MCVCGSPCVWPWGRGRIGLAMWLKKRWKFGCYFDFQNNMIVHYIYGVVQHCSNSSANALELLQSCNKPSIYLYKTGHNNGVTISFKSLGPSDAIWRWRSWSTLVQVMTCCLMALNHYLNHCWLIISKVLWHSSEDIIIRKFEDTNQKSKTEDYIFKITLRSSRGQWVNTYQPRNTVYCYTNTNKNVYRFIIIVDISSMNLKKKTHFFVWFTINGMNKKK